MDDAGADRGERPRRRARCGSRPRRASGRPTVSTQAQGDPGTGRCRPVGPGGRSCDDDRRRLRQRGVHAPSTTASASRLEDARRPDLGRAHRTDRLGHRARLGAAPRSASAPRCSPCAASHNGWRSTDEPPGRPRPAVAARVAHSCCPPAGAAAYDATKVPTPSASSTPSGSGAATTRAGVHERPQSYDPLPVTGAAADAAVAGIKASGLPPGRASPPTPCCSARATRSPARSRASTSTWSTPSPRRSSATRTRSSSSSSSPATGSPR